MRNILLFVGCMLLCCSRMYAQDGELFTTVTVDETKLKLDEEKRSRIEKTKSNKLTKKTFYAQVGDLSKLISQGQLTFTMPGAGKVTAKTRHLDAISKTNYKWIGSIDGERFGSVYLYNRDGEISGDIRIDDRSFHLKPAGKDLVLIAETDLTKLRGGRCQHGPEQKKPKEAPKGGRTSDCGDPTKARILILYTQAAVNEYGLAEVQHRANVAVDQFNYAKGISQVQNSRAELQLVGIELTSWQETQNMPNTENDVDQELFSLRNTAVARQVATNSDIVVCITNGHYQNLLGGMAKHINVFFAEDAYAIVEIAWMGEAPTLTHEVGHLYGGHHEQPNDSTPGDAHGYGFGVSFGFLGLGVKTYSTVMYSTFTIGDSGIRELVQWSNPDIQIYDKPTGVNGYSNMARVIASRADYMADLRPPVPGVLVSGISGPNYINCQGTYNYLAVVNCGLGPYSYNWQISSDGFNYTALSSSNTCSLYFASGSGYLNRYLRLTVTSGDGQTSVNTYQIAVDMDNNCGNNVRKSAEPISDFDLEIESAYPNPVQTDLTIKVTLPSQGHTTLDLFDIQGKPVTVVHEGKLDAGVHTFTQNVSSLPAGTYLLKAQSLQQIKTAKIQVVH